MDDSFLKSLNEEFNSNHKQINDLLKEKVKLVNCLNTIQNFPYKLKVPIMIPLPTLNNPIGILEGEVVHPNELLVTLGQQYMCDMTVDQTKDFIKRKIDALHVQIIKTRNSQRMLFERIACIKGNYNSIDVAEEYDSDAEKKWQEQHTQNIKKMKQKEAEEREHLLHDSPEDYFKRLDELEMEESQSQEIN